MPDRIELQPTAELIVRRLNDAGYEAYVVGGCVRDALRGVVANDWDVCTSALPDDTERVFSDRKTIDTGKKHGTIAVLFGREKYEITTFRRDLGYDDARHPDAVSFDVSLEGDLARRDFTVNAMAADASGAVVDPFDGRGDLDRRLIRCVGEPAVRFTEDALRILRALRFASTLGGFTLDPATAAAAREVAPLIGRISGERILVELRKLLVGADAERVLIEYPDVLAAAIPEIAPCIGFEHRSNWHCCDVWEHTCRAIALAPRDDITRLALLFHDIAKPQCAVDKPDGHRSFHDHPVLSAEHTYRRLGELHASRALRLEVTALVEMHDDPLFADPTLVGKYLRRLGVKGFERLCDVQLADALAHNMDYPPAAVRPGLIDGARALGRKLVDERVPYEPSLLAIRGGELGVEGEQVGLILETLCGMCLRGEVENEHDALLAAAKNIRV